MGKRLDPEPFRLARDGCRKDTNDSPLPSAEDKCESFSRLENALAVLDNTDDAKAFNVIWVDPPPHFIVPAPNGG